MPLEWRMDRIIGAGAYGIVACFRNVSENIRVAVKISDVTDTFLIEAKALQFVERNLRAPGICPFFLERMRSKVIQIPIDVKKYPWNQIFHGPQMNVLLRIQRRWEEYDSDVVVHRIGHLPQKRTNVAIPMKAYCKGSLPGDCYPAIDFDGEAGPPLGIIATEFGEGGNMQQCLVEKVWKTRRDLVAIMGGLLAQIGTLHAAGIMHRDLHLENIVAKRMKSDAAYLVDGAALDLVNIQSTSARLVPSLIDFGASTWPRKKFPLRIFRAHTILPHRAPELIFWGHPCETTPRSDVWSLGVIFLHICMCVVYEGTFLPDLIRAHRGMEKHVAIPHPLLLPMLFRIPHEWAPPVPYGFIREILLMAAVQKGGREQWHSMMEEEKGGEGNAVAMLLWFTAHAIGMPDVRAYPELRTSPVYISLANGIRQCSRMSVDYSPDSGWIWHHDALRKFLGRHGMALLREMLQWDPRRRLADPKKVLRSHPFFRCARRAGHRLLKKKGVMGVWKKALSP